MFMISLIAMAADAVVMPEPVRKDKSWFTADDFPVDEFRARRNGSIYYKTVVNPAGIAESCIIEVSTLSAQDKATFCSTVKSRYKYRNLVGPDGAPIYYVLEENFLYFLPGNNFGTPMKPGADFTIDVRSLPKTVNGRVEVAVNVAVDQAGKLIQCDVPDPATYAALAKAACGQLPSIWSAMPEKNAAGQPINYIRQMRVEFREASAPAG